MLDQAARLHQARGREAVQRQQQTWREAEPVGGRVGFGDEPRPEFEGRRAEFYAGAGSDAQPFKQEVGGGGAEDAFLLVEQPGPRQSRFGDEFAIERIGGVDRLGLDQRLVRAVLEPGHRAHVGACRQRSNAREEGQFGLRRLPLVQLETDVAAEQGLSFFGDARRDRAGNRIDAGDHRDAKRNAGDEDHESG